MKRAISVWVRDLKLRPSTPSRRSSRRMMNLRLERACQVHPIATLPQDMTIKSRQMGSNHLMAYQVISAVALAPMQACDDGLER
jgi:hypothetical protein